ncbi:MAG: alpha/beta fold hydrolase [Chloroflexi bacterium]|nr:alpha/beta fold hydrolase [Chloroflexota bacterium]
MTIPVDSFFLQVDGHQVHCRRAGQGPPVVLIHGGASDSRDWLGVMEALAPCYTLYAPDVIGYGRSERREQGYHFAEFIRFTTSFIEKLGLDSCALVGHSLGGQVCLELAIARPELVRKLVLVDTAGFGGITAAGNLVSAALFFWRRLRRVRQPFPVLLNNNGGDTERIYAEKLIMLKAPSLLIWQRWDLYFPLKLARRALRLMPHAELEVLPGFGHAPHLAHPAGFSRVLADFLGRA